MLIVELSLIMFLFLMIVMATIAKTESWPTTTGVQDRKDERRSAQCRSDVDQSSPLLHNQPSAVADANAIAAVSGSFHQTGPSQWIGRYGLSVTV
jgi:hypothetical protein